MCAEVLTHDLLVRSADTGVVAPPCASSCRSGEKPRSWSMGFGGGLLVGVFGVGAVRARRSFYMLKDSCPFLRMFAPSCLCLTNRSKKDKKK